MLGLTVFEVRPVTVPTDWLMERVVAFDAVHESVAEFPKEIFEGPAEKSVIVGAGAAGRASVVKVKSGEDVVLPRASIEVALK